MWPFCFFSRWHALMSVRRPPVQAISVTLDSCKALLDERQSYLLMGYRFSKPVRVIFMIILLRNHSVG
jgi:hypothetical protein